MNCRELEEFIEKRMKMTHIYQPMMLKVLLQSDTKTATVEDVARAFLNEDESQLNYYKRITKRWPHITLKKHGIIRYSKETYTLQLDGETPEEIARLVGLCDKKLEEFIEKDPWIKKFREVDMAPVARKDRYAVFARSKGTCMACGIKSTDAMLDVDHIVPRSLGGTNEPGNLQALCYNCNRAKKNHDKINYLKWHKRLQFRNPRCSLCDNSGILGNTLAHIRRPADPASDRHYLVVPNRHVKRFAELIPAERSLCLALLDRVMAEAAEKTGTSDFEISRLDGTPENHCRISIAYAA